MPSSSDRGAPDVTRASGRPATVQRRRIERTEAILGAAEALLAEQGYRAATLRAIGERAGIPTSSVYHYFGDRDQVDAELLRRHLAALRERITARLNARELRTVRDAVDAVVDPLLAHGRRTPAFVRLWREKTAPLVELGREFDESLAERTRRVLVDHALIRPDTPLLAVQLAFEAGDRLFDVAFERSRRGDTATVDEARRLVTAYLETYAPPAPGN
ncbi:TetR/AcrR family transcriptional regulator [Kitasatospora sp. NPDC004799]|uniref:TetR/AcrR family transcriptional regulator n=1 Tax=Kitasatospora sp. NPDC004799 TaxID=3154460 RepID=UPI0033B83801